jgi:inner membrane protein
MFFWYLGIAALVVYVTLGRRRVDYRFVLAGAVLPDAVDGALCATLLACRGTGRGISHSLLGVIVVAVVVVVAYRDREKRVSRFGLSVGWLVHLVADGMWQAPETFLWPAFGTAFAATPAEPYSWSVFTQPWDHVWLWAGEIAGLAVLAWFVAAFRLYKGARLREFLSDGYLRPDR